MFTTRMSLTLLFLLSALWTGAAHGASFLIEAEDFQFKGGWAVASVRAEQVGQFLTAAPDKENPKPAEASTVIRLASGGRFTVWVRSRDYAQYMPRTRRYRVALDGVALETEGGRHGQDGWAWERLGEIELKAGDHLLALRHVNSYPRCDRIVLAGAGEVPSSWSEAKVKTNKLAPVIVETATIEDKQESAIQGKGGPAEAGTTNKRVDGGVQASSAKLENEFLRLWFESAGQKVIQRAELKMPGGNWAPLPQFGSGERLSVLHAANPGLQFPPSLAIHPSWTPRNSKLRITVGGKPYTVYPGATNNPFEAAEAIDLHATSARQVEPGIVEVKYQNQPDPSDPTDRSNMNVTATGRWSLEPGARDVRFSLTITPRKTGYYSVGYCAFTGWKKEDVRFVQLPPLFQFQRLPAQPVLLSSSITPQPLALVQVRPDGQRDVSFALAAEPEALPFVWPTIRNARYGFSLLNAARQVQPCSFAPVLGYDGSKWEAGKPQTVAWRLLAIPGDWKAALEHFSEHVMQYHDYRRPLGASLTEAALNMTDLMQNEAHSGWDAKMKGFYDIETQAMSKHAAPLELLSVAMLTRNEDFFKNFALPTIEFTLSRRRADIVDPALNPGNTERDAPKLVAQLHVPTMHYGTSYWQGVHELLGQLNPWLEEFALPGGQPVMTASFNSSARFAEWLAAWRFRPDPVFLENARREADAFLQKSFYGRQTVPVDWHAFYNISFYPNWWNLLDLYEATGEKRYRDAAEEGAFHTVAGLWSHPRVPEGEVTIHPDGQAASSSGHIWWRNEKPYRLGWPRQAGDTPARRVPAWQVAQTGLGLEQPSTYVAQGSGDPGMRNIMNATWAPHLLRAWQATGRELFRTYARGGVIGRFANYPGYYLTLFTDLVHDPEFPLKGPDLTSIYYHHIPVHLGFTLDTLVTEAGARSGGRVKFPYVTQKDYAWFNNRVYGAMPGEVFGEKDVALWLDRAITPCRATEVDWLAARAPERVYFMFMNQLHEPVTAPLKFNAEKLGLKRNAPGTMHQNGDAKETEVAWETLNEVTIPPLGMVTLSLPAERREDFPRLAPLQQGHEKKVLGAPWGELHAFRIRSPFGADGLYVVLTGEPPQGSRAQLKLDGKAAQAMDCNRFPYEFSVYPLPMEDEIRFSVSLESPGAGKPETISMKLGIR